MSYGVRGYGVREYGDGMRVITEVVGGGVPSDNIAGTDTLTFGGSGTLGTSLRGNDILTFGGTGVLAGAAMLVTADATSVPQNKVTFGGYAQLTAEVAVVAPPATLRNVKRVSPTMPTPVLDARGKPT